MTEPSPPRPVPGPPRPAPGPVPVPGPGLRPTARPVAGDPSPAGDTSAAADLADADGQAISERSFAGLAHRPVGEHVAVFEAEHARLQRELSTIDQL